MEDDRLDLFCQHVSDELYYNIVPFWLEKTPDYEFGGFYGRITNQLDVEKNAPKSLILTSRVLWMFARLYEIKPEKAYLTMANHAYRFLADKFIDRKYGGTYWMVDYKGNVLTDTKKIYGQAFSIYALAQYYQASGEAAALEEARQIFELIEIHNYDALNGGYFESSNRDWSKAKEMRLSDVDMNEMKSMNTHLHLMEAYTALYRVWPDEKLKQRLFDLVANFRNFILDPLTMHLKLFFDEKWQSKSSAISYGHDIESSWLLCEAAGVLNDQKLIEEISEISMQMLSAAIREGFSESYSIFAEKTNDGKLHKHTDWWQQAEAVVGFINGYQLSRQEIYFDWAVKCWQFIDKHIIDHDYGEWFYMTDEKGHADHKKFKVSEWKGPYHNGRACMEIITRLESLTIMQKVKHET